MFVGFQIFANLSNSIWSQCQFPRVAESRIVDVTGQPNALRTGNFGLKDSTVFRGIKAQAKKKISPAGVALSMVPNPRHIITDCYISTSVKESNMANEKYQTAEIKGRRQRVFNTFASNVFHPSNRASAVRLPISKQRVHLVRMHQACTHYIIVQHGLVVVKSCSCPVMFEFWNSVEWTHTGSAALSHTLADVWAYAGMGLLASSGTKVVWQHTSNHFKQLNIHHV